MFKSGLTIVAMVIPFGAAKATPIYLDCEWPATAAVTLHVAAVLDEASKTASFTVKESSGIWTDKPALFLPNEIKVALGYDGVRRRAMTINRETLALTYETIRDRKEPEELHGQCKVAEHRKTQI
jgi:hypothetical protein